MLLVSESSARLPQSLLEAIVTRNASRTPSVLRTMYPIDVGLTALQHNALDQLSSKSRLIGEHWHTVAKNKLRRDLNIVVLLNDPDWYPL